MLFKKKKKTTLVFGTSHTAMALVCSRMPLTTFILQGHGKSRQLTMGSLHRNVRNLSQ